MSGGQKCHFVWPMPWKPHLTILDEPTLSGDGKETVVTVTVRSLFLIHMFFLFDRGITLIGFVAFGLDPSQHFEYDDVN